MKILAIDPGFAKLGFAIASFTNSGAMIVSYGTSVTLHGFGFFATDKETKKRMTHIGSDDGRRIDLIAHKYVNLVELEAPDAIAYELPAAAKGARAMHALGMSHACVRASIGARTNWRIPFIELTALDVKAALGLAKGTTKQDVEDKIIEAFPAIDFTNVAKAKDKREHVFDAIAIAIAASRTSVALALRRVA